MMNYKEIYINRHDIQGRNYKESFRNQSKVMANEGLLTSYDRVDVKVNFTDIYPSIVRDIDTFKVRKFTFAPDSVVHLGDYIEHDGFTYLTMKRNTNDIYPYVEANQCNYDFPVRVEEISTDEIVGRRPNNSPIYKTKKITHTVPSVTRSKIYSQVENAIIATPEGSLEVFLPYRPNEPSPELDQEVVVHDSQYYVADIIKTNIINFNGIEKGYLELRLQRTQKNE